MAYNHLTEIERYHIQWYLENNFSLRKIAIALGRNVSTISREIARCQALGFQCYIADYRSKIEAVINRNTYKLKGKLLKTVKYLLKKKFSPEQISGWLWVKKGIKISHTAIKTYFITKPKTKKFTKKNCDLCREIGIKTSMARCIFLKEWVSNNEKIKQN